MYEDKSHYTVCFHGVDRNNYTFTTNNLNTRKVVKEFQRVCSLANWCSIKTMNDKWTWIK
jgi:hypothetical protein